jgi:hypothetical protein
MLISELVKELQDLLETQGDIAVVVRSQDVGFEAANFTDLINHDGASCLLID